ncbi:MAG TPA: glycosyltransferase family 4 protein [Candidatus Limnocylindrales bacterium]
MNGITSGNGHQRRDDERLRIALLAAPMASVPPVAYGGTERVVAALATELTRRGHQVTVFASGDSWVEAEVEPVVPQALWGTGYQGDVSAHMLKAAARGWAKAEQFDLIHSHLEAFGFLLARHAPVPVLSTLHGRLDGVGMPELIEEFADIPLVAISESQRRWAPAANWAGVVHNGLALADMPQAPEPDDYLLFVGRVAVEKGIEDAIALARRARMPLKVVAKVHDATEHALYRKIRDSLTPDDQVEFLGELPPSARDPLYARARATLMLGAWPEPFGLVAIESMACGTPVIARRAGALPEILRHGTDGYLVDDVGEAELAVRMLDQLDRSGIRESTIERFSASRMTDAYERIYRRMLRPRTDRTPREERLTELVAGAR